MLRPRGRHNKPVNLFTRCSDPSAPTLCATAAVHPPHTARGSHKSCFDFFTKPSDPSTPTLCATATVLPPHTARGCHSRYFDFFTKPSESSAPTLHAIAAVLARFAHLAKETRQVLIKGARKRQVIRGMIRTEHRSRRVDMR